jgi:nitrate/nitrite transporter NarK
LYAFNWREMEDSVFVIFLSFGFIWLLMGVVGWIAFLKSEGEEIKFGKWGLIVAIPILIPIIVSLIIGILYKK